jgi:DNA-binding beta-propeller fold protein YncE/mono/diheme cytochrome c family protein
VVLAEHRGETVAYVADEDSRALHVVSVDRGESVGKTQLSGVPAQALVLADGRVAVALRDRSSVVVLEPQDDLSVPLATLCETRVPSEAWGLAATPDDARLLVTSGWGAALSVLDGSTLDVIREVPLPREPRAVIVADDGRRAFVSHAIGSRVSVVSIDDKGAAPRALELGVEAPLKPREGGGARTGSQGFALAKAIAADSASDKRSGERPLLDIEGRAPGRPKPSAARAPKAPKAPAPAAKEGAPEAARPVVKDRIFVPMATVDPGNSFERSSDYYGRWQRQKGPLVAEPIVGVIDASRERALTRDLLTRPNGEVQPGCVLPRAAATSARGSLFVACLGIDAVLELDARGADPMRMELRRFRVPAGPTGVALDPAERRAVVWSQWSGSLTVLDLGARTQPSTSIEVDYTPAPGLKAAREGRELFHRSADDRMSSNGMACASCHPDGRDDGITWSTSSGPRQTLMLAGRMEETAPYGWRGQQKDLPEYLSHTIARLGGYGLEPQALTALEAFVESVPPPPAPALIDERAREKDEAVARGRELFFDVEQGCARCHVDAVGTDKKLHDVGSRAQADDAANFDTPTLRFIGKTAPYFHDGRYATLSELLAAPDSGMGRSAHLSAVDRAALVAFLETL